MADLLRAPMPRRRLLRLLAATSAAAVVAAATRCGGDDGEDRAGDGRAPAPTPSNADLASRVLVRQIDHVLVHTDDAARLFAVLTEDLALPVAWPLFTYRGFSSGAVGFGNTNVEILQHVEGDAPAFAAAPGTYPIGVALEPVTIDGALRELDARGIEHSSPFDDGINDAVRWTSIDLKGPPECPVLLFVKYGFDQDARRAQLGRQLVEGDGGPLGALGVHAVEVGVRDVAAAMQRWQTLFAPAAGAPRWRLGDGPQFHLVEHDSDAFQRVVLSVASLPQATTALRDRGLLGETSDAWTDMDAGGGGGAIRLAAAGTG
jgi:hypothetical protein